MKLQELRRGQRFKVKITDFNGGVYLTGKLVDKTQGAALVEFDGRSGAVTVSLGTPVEVSGHNGPEVAA